MSADDWLMVEARFELAPTARGPGRGSVPSTGSGAVSGATSTVPDVVELLGDLTSTVPWELEYPGNGLRFHGPVHRLFGAGADRFLFQVRATSDSADGGPVQPGSPGQVVDADALGTRLLAPIVTTVEAGIVWDSYELIQEVDHVGGHTYRVVVRAVAEPDSRTSRLVGVIGLISPDGEVPWARVDMTERLELLVKHSPDGIIVHQDGLLVYANEAAARMAGYESTQLVLGKPITAFLHPEHLEGTISRLASLKDPGDVVKGYEAALLTPAGRTQPIEVASVRTSWGGKPAFQVIMRDISERKLAEEEAIARRAIERRYAAAASALEEGVVVVGRDGTVQATNDSAERILGERLEHGRGDAVFTGGAPALQTSGERFDAADLPIAAAIERHSSVTKLVIGVRVHGAEQWLSVSTRPMLEEEAGDDAAVVCSVSDITESKRLMDRLAWEARHDPLTGLANRSGFLAAVQDLADHPLPDVTGLALFFIDLDRFKLVNDSLGHAVGDEVLLEVAKRLRETMPRCAALSRLHGDEFAVLEPGVVDTDAALQRAEELRNLISRPIQLSTGRTLTVTPSVGLVWLEALSGEANSLLQDADMAMLQAKTRGRGRVALFDAGLREEVGSRLELEHELRAAVENGELRLEYQPLASLSNGRTLGLEALVRWEHPKRGLLMPARFVALAEESELIVALGRWVLEAGCRQMAEWRREHPGAANAFLAVNVSPRQLEGGELLPAVERALDRSGLPASALMLEITETGLVSEDIHIHALLRDLRALGVRLAIDDFGTGYSSLSYLKHLPVGYLKVDRSFVSGLGTNTEDERIVAAVTELAHGLGLRVIAEGVETRQQRQVARQLGCDLYQGYFLARPCRPRDVPPMFSPPSATPSLD